MDPVFTAYHVRYQQSTRIRNSSLSQLNQNSDCNGNLQHKQSSGQANQLLCHIIETLVRSCTFNQSLHIDADVNAEVAVLHDEKIADDVQVDWAGVAAMELRLLFVAVVGFCFDIEVGNKQASVNAAKIPEIHITNRQETKHQCLHV
uniref:Uncharacterized protein n=1 Tax=Glossina pallidipes TaxID=7398 RepID=A0A1B0A515_GLOPL